MLWITAEPISAVLSLDSFPVGKTFVGINPPGFNLTGQELDVDLNRTYAVNCVVRGGHPKPNVTLATVNKRGQLVVQYDAVAVVVETERDADNWLSEPDIKVNASMQWKPNVDVLARQLVCRAGFEKPRAIEADFVPVVDTGKPFLISNRPQWRGGAVGWWQLTRRREKRSNFFRTSHSIKMCSKCSLFLR